MNTYTLWIEGYEATGQSSGAQCLGDITGTDFNDAVKNYVEKLSPGAKSYWCLGESGWSYWGCKAFDNAADARSFFG